MSQMIHHRSPISQTHVVCVSVTFMFLVRKFLWLMRL